MRLLAEKLVELKMTDRVSTMTVQRSLKNERQPHLSKYWKIPPDGDAAFVAAMEDVLAVYQRPHDPRFPVVCLDKSNKQLVGEVHAPITSAPGRGRIVDHEYVRHGVATLFVEAEPLAGRRPRQDWARFIKTMLDERYPQAIKVRLVVDSHTSFPRSSCVAPPSKHRAKLRETVFDKMASD